MLDIIQRYRNAWGLAHEPENVGCATLNERTFEPLLDNVSFHVDLQGSLINDLPYHIPSFQPLMSIQSSPPPSSQAMFSGSHLYIANGTYTQQHNSYGLAVGQGVQHLTCLVDID